MTADEFLAWPGDGTGRKFQLVDGVVVAQSPATTTHNRIQSRLDRLIGTHLDKMEGPCEVLVEPAVAVRVNAGINRRVPDLGVTCEPDMRGDVDLPDPVLLVEILSPGSREETWQNVWAYTTIPSLREILIVSSFSVMGELLRRDADGAWPEESLKLGVDDAVALTSIGLEFPLRAIYRKTYLEQRES